MGHTEYMREWRKRNPTSNRDTLRRLRERDPGYMARSLAAFHEANPHKKAEYRQRYNERHAAELKVSRPLYSRLHKVLTGQIKGGRTAELVGCTALELRAHVARQFTEGMSWENYGEWQIDHKIPLSKFDLSDIEQQKECFHFSNLQPLWAKDNLKKASK